MKIEITREQFNLIYDTLNDRLEDLNNRFTSEIYQDEIMEINDLLKFLEPL